MELQQLKYFREVAEQQHVTRAAEKLFVSQSAVSRAIAQLEEELGVALFHRQGRSLVLSRFGEQYLSFVIQAQNALAHGSRVLKEQTSTESGTVALGFLGSLGAELVPQLIGEYRRLWPDVKFTLIQRSGEALSKQLLEGSLDLCLSVPGTFEQPDFEWIHLRDEPLVVALPQSHKLAARRTLRLQELQDEAFLALSSGRTLRAIFEQACATAGFSPNIAFEAMDTTTLRGMAAAGLGIALLPPSSARVRGIVEINLSKPRPIRSIGMVWVSNRYLPPCSASFRSFAASYFGKA